MDKAKLISSALLVMSVFMSLISLVLFYLLQSVEYGTIQLIVLTNTVVFLAFISYVLTRREPRAHVTYLLFAISFFVFLMGRYIVNIFSPERLNKAKIGRAV